MGGKIVQTAGRLYRRLKETDLENLLRSLLISMMMCYLERTGIIRILI